ncbi:DUF6879 family protein [Streptomyces acidiscabies]|uniref:DUF6879 family protein n=1 Tax=Streptomyces acidiscabies TaxID=42234 RepID=UPI0038F6A142
MALIKLGQDPESDDGKSPTVCLDDENDNYVLQGWKLDPKRQEQMDIPAHETAIDTVPTLEDRLRACTRSAIHLEMRDGYMRSAPSFVAWQNGTGDDQAEFDPVKRPWLRLISDIVAKGVEVRRARIVSEPVSEYIRFEHQATPGNVAAGEQVRWLPRRHASRLALPGNDFWLFDDSSVLFYYFTGDGEVPPEPEDEEFVEDPAVVKFCVDAFEAVWALGTDHSEYVLR